MTTGKKAARGKRGKKLALKKETLRNLTPGKGRAGGVRGGGTLIPSAAACREQPGGAMTAQGTIVRHRRQTVHGRRSFWWWGRLQRRARLRSSLIR